MRPLIIVFMLNMPVFVCKYCNYKINKVEMCKNLLMTLLQIQWEPVIRTSSGVEKHVLITGMFL